MAKIFIAGHRGMVGSAISRQLALTNFEVITATRDELDLTNQGQVGEFLAVKKVDQVFLAAAKVGGIHANNTYPAEFIYQNLMIQNNIIHSSYRSGVRKLLFLGSSCIYPKLAAQPMREGELLSGYLEPTNEPYAVAKIAGIKMCESYNRQYGVDYRSVMPTNLYGPGDNYHPENSHVIPALIRRFHEAKEKGADEVIAWGTGSALREFLHVDDMARAAVHVMNLDIESYKTKTSPMLSHFNVGTGTDCSIKELTEMIAEVIGFSGKIRWDTSKPDGAPRKLMDSGLLKSTGWRPNLGLEDGLRQTYAFFLDNLDHAHK
jgi:GDP-L-fucose synthase